MSIAATLLFVAAASYAEEVKSPSDKVCGTVSDDTPVMPLSLEALQEGWNLRLGIEPWCLYPVAEGWATRDLDKAEDLLALATLRRLYDVRRCSVAPQGPVSSYFAVMALSARGALTRAGRSKVRLETLQRLAFDPLSYDYSSRSLRQMCDGEKVKPKTLWPQEIAAMQAEVQAAPATRP